ncbi:MAG: tRNA (adenosine(37)-N6)-threonylcarbamoyltransferase complex dimerization subunit type 1 TsaB, partial [Myxococcales bacterium]
MRVLALDTSTPTTTCALLDEDAVVWEKSLPPPQKAGDVLPGALGDLQGFDAIAVGLGPGSFTGLRVGLAAAKALAYARRVPIAGASSLWAIALDQPGEVNAATEARKGELFVQPFRDGATQGPVRIVTAADFPEPVLKRPPPARNVARLCLPRLRGASYDVQACFALA